MSFTVLYAVLAVLVLFVVFGVTYKLKGWKIAFLATGAALALSVVFLVLFIYTITGAM